jgi:hypothetical protein
MPKVEAKKAEPMGEKVEPKGPENIVPVIAPTDGNVINSTVKIVEGG